MARAKCLVCGAELDTKTAYRVEIVSKKTGKITYKYCCSEEEWKSEEARKKKATEDKNRVYRLICDLFGYEIQNTQLFAEWKLWNKLKSNEIIYKYLVENKEYLQQICNKSFDGEYQKIRYFSAVLKNSLRDFKPKVEAAKPTTDTSDTFISYTNNKIVTRRKGFAEENDD